MTINKWLVYENPSGQINVRIRSDFNNFSVEYPLERGTNPQSLVIDENSFLLVYILSTNVRMRLVDMTSIPPVVQQPFQELHDCATPQGFQSSKSDFYVPSGYPVFISSSPIISFGVEEIYLVIDVSSTNLSFSDRLSHVIEEEISPATYTEYLRYLSGLKLIKFTGSSINKVYRRYEEYGTDNSDLNTDIRRTYPSPRYLLTSNPNNFTSPDPVLVNEYPLEVRPLLMNSWSTTTYNFDTFSETDTPSTIVQLSFLYSLGTITSSAEQFWYDHDPIDTTSVALLSYQSCGLSALTHFNQEGVS